MYYNILFREAGQMGYYECPFENKEEHQEKDWQGLWWKLSLYYKHKTRYSKSDSIFGKGLQFENIKKNLSFKNKKLMQLSSFVNYQ